MSLIFSCIINDSITNPFINIKYFLEPDKDRQSAESIIMPIDLIKTELEIDTILENANEEELLKMAKPEMKEIIKGKQYSGITFKQKKDLFFGLDEKLRKYLPLRADKIAFSKIEYSRIKPEEIIVKDK